MPCMFQMFPCHNTPDSIDQVVMKFCCRCVGSGQGNKLCAYVEHIEASVIDWECFIAS